MDMFLFVALVFIGICSACFKIGSWDTENTIYKQCLGKTEIVVKDVRFRCVPKAIIINGKEVEYK